MTIKPQLELKVTTTILKTKDFIASDLAEFICQGLPYTSSTSLLLLIKTNIGIWLRVNSVEEKEPKKKAKKTGKREQLKLKI